MTAPKQTEEKNNCHGFHAIDAPKEIQIPTEQINKESILFWIERSKNANIVVYEALKKNITDHYNDMAGYWLDLDPECMKANRKKGKMDDRDELNMIEKKLAYGYKVTATKMQKIYRITIVSVPEINIELVTDETNKPHAAVIINGQRCYLRRIYVAAKENWIGLPKVLYVTITGIQINNGCIQSAKKVLNKP